MPNAIYPPTREAVVPEDPGFPVSAAQPTDVPIRIKDPTRWRRSRLLTVDEAARALRVDEEQVKAWLRKRSLGARWLRAGDLIVPGVKRPGVDELSRRLRVPFTDDDLGEDWLLKHTARFSECPHCGQVVELMSGKWLFVEHDDDGEPCPGGIHGVCDFPILGDPMFGSPRIRFGEDADQWLDDNHWLLLEEALDLLKLPDDRVMRLMKTQRLRTGWVRHDGEAHPVVNSLDVEHVSQYVAGRFQRARPRPAHAWSAAWRWAYEQRIKGDLECCRRCDRRDVAVCPIDDGRFDFDNATILCPEHAADYVTDTDHLVAWRIDLSSLREEELDRPEGKRWGFIAATERSKALAAKYETSP